MMPESFVGLPPDSTGRKLRSRQRVVGANTVEEPYHILTSERVVSAEAMTSTWRTLGAAALLHNLFTLENGTGSGVLVGLRRLSVQMDATAVLAAVAPTVEFYRTSGMPSGGTVLEKTLIDTSSVTAANVVARGANASNGGAATAITATPVAGASGWSQLTMRMHTLVGQIVMDDESLIPALCENTPVTIRPGEAVLARVVAAATGSNPATNNWIINAEWNEFQLP